MKKKLINLISIFSLVFILALSPILVQGLNAKSISEESTVQTRTVNADSSLDFNSLYSQLNEKCEKVSFEYLEDDNQFYLTATQIISTDIFEELDNVSYDESVEGVSLKYDTVYDPETNIVTLIVYANGEQTDTIIGSPFTDENGKVDVAFCMDDEIIFLSELQDACVIQNCGLFSRICKAVAKVAVVVAVAAVTVAVAATVVAVAAPVIATAITTVVSVSTASTAVLGGTALASSLAASAMAVSSIAISTATAATAVAAVTATAAAVPDAISNVGTQTTTTQPETNVGVLAQEKPDQLTLDIVKAIAEAATILSLRELTRVYHIAFVVSQKFSENGTEYNVGDLYISSLALTFNEAYSVLIKSGMINSISDLTSNEGIIEDVNKTIVTEEMQKAIDLLQGYRKNGYFAGDKKGIYADSVEAAATLAVVTGAWIKDTAVGLEGMGVIGGYNHFHNSRRTIHIWYGSKING